MAVKSAISPTRAENYAEWYQQIIKAADMAENSGVRGCMIMKPWGYGIWELLARELDDRFKATGHENCYFPLFIPLSLIQKEAEHAEGFAKEMAVVTHHRLEMQNGKLVPAGELEEPLIVRPTSETIIGEAFARWINSYRDLPVLINQWANVVRWEMRTRLFLRTTEFLWQEGHTAHATKEEAVEETVKMLHVYGEVAEDVLAMPVFKGMKTPHERFAGAVDTYTIEAMVQDGKSIQFGTSHYLGQNFAKAANIKFQSKEGREEFVHTTSWGVSTRMIGALIMAHGDDDGLRLPPKVAPQQVVIVPILRDEADNATVLTYAEELAAALRQQRYEDKPLRVKVDARDLPSADKRWSWIKKGVPLLCEVGMKDIEKRGAAAQWRDKLADKKVFPTFNELVNSVITDMAAYSQRLYRDAQKIRTERLRRDIATLDEFKQYFSGNGDANYTNGTGFVLVPFCGDEDAVEPLLKELGLSFRCAPLDEQADLSKPCLFTGKPATMNVLVARAY